MQSVTPSLIVVIGSDGSGKSTVYEHLTIVVEKYGATERIHLGKQAENVGRAVTELSSTGKSLRRTIERNQVKTVKKLPRPVPTLIVTAFVARRLLRFRHMPACHRRELTVLTDRYPQDQTPGACDGMVFPPSAEDGRFVLQLAGQECKMFHWMASHKPDLVIKLNADLKVACAHRPDHRRKSLAGKIAITPQLTSGDVQPVNIDANQPLEQVLVDTEETITDFMTTHGCHQSKMEMPDCQDRAFSGRLNQL